MSRQIRTLLLGAVLVVVLAVASFGLRVPYVILSPGETLNTLGTIQGQDVITVAGRSPAATSGHLNLTTVSVETQDTTVVGAIRGWLAKDEVVVPHDSIYPPGQTQQQTNQQDQQDFSESQDAAVAAAACQLKYPRGFGIVSVLSDSPNAKVLRAGDAFVSVGGSAVKDSTTLSQILKGHKAGDTLPAVMTRAGKQISLTLTLGAPTQGSTAPRLGVTVADGCLLPFEVTVSVPGIGGPSAGLMFSLGVIDKIGTDDLTGGRFIAGTGTIDPTGAVGAIGGIQLKMLGARRAGATVFLAPAGNCADVKGNIPAGLEVVKVSTLQDAITSLDTLKAGGTNVPHC